MIGERVALLAGLFLAPAALLWIGHGFRELSPRSKRVFWGGVIGHTIALVVTLVAAMSPPIAWAGGNFWRDFAVHWSLLLGALLGGAAGAVLGRTRR
jgi:hypothetical protein